MIYKGIVEKIVGKEIQVRIPTLHKSDNAVGSTDVGQLSLACICSLPGIDTNLQVNDIVFVDFEDTLNESPVILGTLYGFNTTSKCNISVNDLEAKITARLPKDIRIGDITYSHLDKLTGITYNIQSKFDEILRFNNELTSRISKLEEEIKQLKS